MLACSGVQAQQEPETATKPSSDAKADEKKAPAEVEKKSDAKADGAATEGKDVITHSFHRSEPDQKVNEAFGADLMTVIKSADKVELVTVSVGKNADAKKTLQGHEVTGEPVIMDDAAVRQLRQLIYADDTHMFNANSRCRFRPSHGVIFHAGEKTASVLIAAPRCPKWSFSTDPKRTIITVRKAKAADIASVIGTNKEGESK